MFFDGSDKVHQTLSRVSAVLSAAGIDYAIMGGMAVNAHRYQRTTADVDFLLTSEGFAAFLQLLASSGFENVADRPRRFLDRGTGVTFDILITGLFPGSGDPGPVAFPNPADVSESIGGHRVLTLAALVQLKLAARRYKDFGDVVELIRIHDLDESFRNKLNPALHGDFIECLEEKRREDAYEARQDEAFKKNQPGGAPGPSA